MTPLTTDREVIMTRMNTVRTNKAVVLFATAFATLALCGPVAAAAPSESTTKGAVAAPAEKPSKFALPHHVTGDVVSVDQSAKMLTMKDSKGREFRLTVTGEAATRLGDFRPGDRVRVTYKKSHGQMIASKIAQGPATRTQ